ncbi:MAG: class F sortase [Chloroflexi bacterium]|nr:class F sortase [Chloroflexota bacterium]
MSAWFSSSTLLRRACVAGLIAMLALAVACGGDGKKASDTTAPNGVAGAGEPNALGTAIIPLPTQSDPSAVNPVATPEFPAPSEDAALARLVIPSAKVNAPLQVKGVNARNEMENPDGKDNVAWYNFTAKPGFGSNAVFSGHVDWYTGEQAVFWYLRNLKAGDEVMLKLSDGTELKYRVTRNEVYSVLDAPVAEIIGPTSKDTVTLITCEGTFDRASQEYDKRRMVRAERIA